MTSERLNEIRAMLELEKDCIPEMRGWSGEYVADLLAYVDELKGDCETMASNWAHADGDGKVSCWFCQRYGDGMESVVHAPDCLAVKYGGASK